MVRRLSKSLVWFIPLLIFFLPHPAVAVEAQESSCVACHTSPRKLIEVIRELEASKPRVEKPAESTGEG